MFSELDRNRMIGCNKCLRQLFLATLTTEEVAPYEYGVSNTIPLIFFDSHKRDTQGVVVPTVISKTPQGKVIFPGTDLRHIGVETGVLYRDLFLEHRPSFCRTKGVDFRTEEYWNYLLAGRKFQAIKEYRNTAHSKNIVFRNAIGLREAKGVVDGDAHLFMDPPKKVGGGYRPYAAHTGGTVNFLQPPPKNLFHRLVKEISEGNMANMAEAFGLPLSQLSQGDLQPQHDLDVQKERVWELEIELRREVLAKGELEGELKELYTKYLSLQEKLTTDYLPKEESVNAWKIVNAKPEESTSVVLAKITKAIMLYHPDKISYAGELLVSYANKILRELLEFKKTIERRKNAVT